MKTDSIYGAPVIDPDSPDTMYWQGVWYIRHQGSSEWQILKDNYENNTSDIFTDYHGTTN